MVEQVAEKDGSVAAAASTRVKSPPRGTRRNSTPPARQPRASSKVSCAWRRKTRHAGGDRTAGRDAVGDAAAHRGGVRHPAGRRREGGRPRVAVGADPDLDAQPGADVERAQAVAALAGAADRLAVAQPAVRRLGTPRRPAAGVRPQHLALARASVDRRELGVGERGLDEDQLGRGGRDRGRERQQGQEERSKRRDQRRSAEDSREHGAIMPTTARRDDPPPRRRCPRRRRSRGTSTRRHRRRRRCRHARRP